MRRIIVMIPALLFLAVSWAAAGTFEGLADRGVPRADAPLFIKPGTVVKAEFKSNLRDSGDMELESDLLLPEESASATEPSVTPKPAPMAPPPNSVPRTERSTNTLAQSEDRIAGNDLDLEKDLVISPPRNTREEAEEAPAIQAEEKKPAPSPRSVAETKKKKSRAASRGVAKVRRYAAEPQPIVKVKPQTTRNGWSVPAAAHRRPAHDYHPRPMVNEPSRRIAMPPTVDRFVRDGVTVKLAPQAVPAGGYPEYAPESTGDELLNAAAELIGLPFAFISSMF